MTALELSEVVTLVLGDVQRVLSLHQATGFKTDTRVDVRAFARMLAKIAHCYHVQQRGFFPLAESPIVATILKDEGEPRIWLGTTSNRPLELKVGSTAMHLLQIDDLESDDGSLCTVVRIRLFAPLRSPTYIVTTRLSEQQASVISKPHMALDSAQHLEEAERRFTLRN